MSSVHGIQNIALVGASGTIGQPTLKALIAADKFKITVLTRAESSATFPEHGSVIVKKGDLMSSDFLDSALKGQEALIVMLGFKAPPNQQILLIDAAAKAGVKWIIPCEFGSDNANPIISEGIPINSHKTAPRRRIEEMAKSHPGLSWIGVVTNPWIEHSLRHGAFAIDIKAREATLYDDGATPFNTTLIADVAYAVMQLMSLPITAEHGTSLSSLQNKFVYVSSFLISQKELLEAVQRVTGTKPADWNIKYGNAQEWIDAGRVRLSSGDFMGMANILYGSMFKEGLGGNYEETRGLTKELLRDPQVSLDNALRPVVQEVLAGTE